MKKVIYGIIACIIIAGIIITLTLGLRVGLAYSENVQINIYIGKHIELKDINNIVKEVFPNEKFTLQKIEYFDDMVAITLPEKSDEEIKENLQQLIEKINEKTELNNTVEENIAVVHNSKVRLSSLIKPYILPISTATAIIVVYATIRYRKLGILKVITSYLIYIATAEALLISLVAITRYPFNRLIIPMGLAIYVGVITALGIKNEKKVEKIKEK